MGGGRVMKALSVAALLVISVCGDCAADHEIVIIGTTDVHARLTHHDYSSGNRLPGSLARAYTLIKELRSEHGNTLLLDSGDLLQGNPLEEIHLLGVATGDDPVAKVTNFMGYDAVVVGNHDLDFGLDVLASVARQCRYPWLAANMRRADTNERVYPAYVLKEMAGVRIAVVGLTNQGPAVWLEGSVGRRLRFADPVEEARTLIPEIRSRENADLVVVLAHGGLGEPPWRPGYGGYQARADLGPENFVSRLAREVGGIDVILAGHSHEEVRSHQLGGCLVVQAGDRATSIAVVRVTLSIEPDRVTVTSKTADLVSTRGVAPSDEILGLVTEDEQTARAYLAEPLAVVSSRMEAASCRIRDSGIVDLVHRAQKHFTGAQLSAAGCFAEDLVIAPGEVTRADLLSIYPYPNTLAAVQLTGREVRDYLEHAAEYFPQYDFSGRGPEDGVRSPGYQYDTLEGVEYELDLTRSPGNRVTELEYRGQPLREDALLKVAVNSYRRGGGGDYPAVAGAPVVYDRQQDIRSLLAEYVQQVGLVTSEATGNWRIVPDYLTHWGRQRIDYLYRSGLPSGRPGEFRPEEAALTKDLAEWLCGEAGAGRATPAMVQACADSLGLPWEGELQRLDALRLLFACTAPETAGCRGYAWRFDDWQQLGPQDQTTVGTAVARGWLADMPWDRARTPAPVTRGEAASLAYCSRFRKVVFAATNDLHGGLEGRVLAGPGAVEVGGIARIGALVDSVRWRNPGAVVLLDVGDLMQGTLISNLYSGRPVIETFNLMRYDAAVLGNHELDWGQEVLQQRIAEARFPFLSANTVEEDSGTIPRWLEPSVLFERGDLKVGVVGLSPPDMRSIVKVSHLEGLEFREPEDCARREVGHLLGQGAQVIVLAAHVGVDRSEEGGWIGPALDLARNVDSVELVFSGHSHSLLDTIIGGCPVVQARCCGQALALAEIVYDTYSDTVVARSAHVVTRLDGTKNPSLDSLVAHYRADVDEQGTRVVARLAQPLSRLPSEAGESALGDLIADAQRAATGADVALMNPGGIRADLPEGETTWEMLYTVQPFGNTLVLLKLTGAQLHQALEQGVSRSGRAVQVSGVTFTLNPDAEAGARVRQVALEKGDALVAEDVYSVVVNDFMYGGGDRFAVLKEAQDARDTYTIDVDALEQHLASLPQPITYELQNRITLAE
jgi:2',3'-cyclic-nucleotide 2'-phosphodiesterase/3'-nucleotidase